MKKFAILLAFSLIASSAFAIVDDGIASVGIYFDQTADTNCAMPAQFTPFNVYFILVRPEVPNMGAFELNWRYNPEPAARPTILNMAFAQGAINIGDNYNMIVGLGLGLPTTEATVLATANMMLLTALPNPTFLQVGPTVPASHPGFISYVGFADPEVIRHMAIANGAVDANGWSVPGVASFGCPGPVATESATMGNVKALFQ